MRRFAPQLRILPEAQRVVWKILKKSIPHDFVLYGGTSIAIRLGHRSSVDFDFFSSERFDPGELAGRIRFDQRVERIQSSPNTLTLLVGDRDTVKVSFFGELSIGRVDEPEIASDTGLPCASLLDLSATKLKALHDRAESKDYVDIAALLSSGIELGGMLGAARALYGDVFNPMITLKALTYFQDGNLPDLPSSVREVLQKAAENVGTVTSVSRKSDRLSSTD